jgi:antitoxin (DNA-binding transcriptional repressor) of toxin-antitoxin stability system
MSEIGGCEVKTHLSALLDRSAAGETITITRHGVPVAVLGPPPSKRKMSVREAIAAVREFRNGRHVTQAEIREWIEEGRDRIASCSTIPSSSPGHSTSIRPMPLPSGDAWRWRVPWPLPYFGPWSLPTPSWSRSGVGN